MTPFAIKITIVKLICWKFSAIRRVFSTGNFVLIRVLSPAEQYPLGYYQDRCWHSHPRFLIQPQVFNFSHPRLLFCPRFSFFATLGYYSTLGFLFFLPQATFLPQVFSFCHPNSPLGFLFFPPQATIPPQVFFFSLPRLLFHPRFSLFPTLGYYPALGFHFFPTLGYYPALGLYSAGKSTSFRVRFSPKKLTSCLSHENC